MLIDGQLAAAELPAFRPAGAPRFRAAALESPSRREWVEGRRPPAGLGPRQPSAGAAPMLPLGRSDPSSRRSARAKRRAPAAELLWWLGRPCAAWCCWSGAGWRWLASQKGEKTPPLAPIKPQGQGRKQGACLGLDPAALPARQVAGAWANHWGKCSPLRCTTADAELQQTNRVKRPGFGPRQGLWPLGQSVPLGF